MKEPSPFTLVRTANAPSNSDAQTSESAPRPKVVLPTRRKEIPQASEPILLLPLSNPDEIKDAVARLKKAAKAQPLEPAPRPAKAERKELLAAVIPAADPVTLPTERRLGATLLPPPRKVRSGETEEKPECDPFETNSIAPEILNRKPKTYSVPNDLVSADPPVSPPSTQQAKFPYKPAEAQPIPVAPTPEENVTIPLAPRHKPQLQQFATEGSSRPVPQAEAAPKKTGRTSLPPKRGLANLNHSSDLTGWMQAEGVATKGHTPRSEEPIEDLRMKNTERPMISRRRMKFCCPACNHTISMPKKMGGHKTRCPQCASAIRAPHPKYQRGTYNYELSIESLIHPERFPLPENFGPRFLGTPVPNAHTTVVGSAAAILVAGSAWFMNFRQDSVKVLEARHREQLKSLPHTPEQEFKMEQGFDSQKTAQDVVREFLVAEGWEAKSKFVRESERVAPLMKDHYEKRPNADLGDPKTMRSSAPSYYQGENLKQRRSDVFAEFGNGRQARYVVEFLPEGAKIEWESSVAYSPAKWDEIITSVPDTKEPPQLMRVAACVDKYYNNQFSNDREYLSIYLQDPITGEPLGNGYISRMSEDGIRLRKFLYGAGKNNPDRIMVEVRPVENSARERIVEITRFVKSGFRAPENSTVASK